MSMRHPEPPPARLDAVDWLRGLVMVVMALDHVREFFTLGGVNPEDSTKASAALFFTRWITHFCAPTFVLLAGAGAYLYGARGRSRTALAWFLVTRGFWLVFLELTWVRWAALFNLDYHFSFGQVIWAIGWSMVLLSTLVWLPAISIGLIGGAMAAGQHLLSRVDPARIGVPQWLWDLFFRQRPFELAPDYVFFNVYPLSPGSASCSPPTDSERSCNSSRSAAADSFWRWVWPCPSLLSGCAGSRRMATRGLGRRKTIACAV